MRITRFLPILLFIVLAMFFWYGLRLNPKTLPNPKIGQYLPEFNLPMLLESPGQRFTPQVLHSTMNILVVWASWCETCREEQSFLLQLAQQKGVHLYGMNYKDDPDQAKQWLTTWGNPFQAIGVDRLGQVGIELGVYGTPETYLIDAKGKILHRYAGLLTAEIWQKEFAHFINQS